MRKTTHRVIAAFGGKVLSRHGSKELALKAAVRHSRKEPVHVWTTTGGSFGTGRPIAHLLNGEISLFPDHSGMTTTGTSYFVSRRAAECFYLPYENGDQVAAKEAVARKLEAGEIHVGKPELKAGEGLRLIDGGLRWAITSAG